MSIIGMRTKMSKYLQWLVLGIAATFAIGVIAMAIGSGQIGSDEQRETGVIAKVNGEKLMWQDYLNLLQRQREMYNAQGISVTPMQEIQERGQILDEMINEVMWVQAAKKEGIKVSGGEVKKKIDEYVDTQIKSLREQALKGKKQKTDAVFEAALAKAEPGMTIKKKRAEIRKYFVPVSDKIRNSMMTEKLYKKIDDSVPVTDRALEESYDQATISQITVGVTGKRSDEQAKKRADEIVAKLKKGGDFAVIAGESSDDMYAQFGGRRGPVPRASAEPELKEAMFKLGKNEVSDPIKTDKGYVILKSEGVMHNVPSDFSDPKRKREYKDQYAQQARQTARGDYEKKLRKEMKLEILDPELKAYAALKDSYTTMMTMEDAERKAAVDKVIKLYQAAIEKSGDQTDVQARCNVQLAMLYGMLKASPMFGLSKAEQDKYGKLSIEAVSNALNYTEDNGLRITLARLAIDAKDFKTAEESLQIASENAYDEVQTHEQIRDMYKEMNRPDLVAAEQKWIDDYKRDQAANDDGSVTSEPVRIPAGGQ